MASIKRIVRVRMPRSASANCVAAKGEGISMPLAQNIARRLVDTGRRALYIRHILFGLWLRAILPPPGPPAMPIPAAIDRVLVIRLDGLGDWILTSAFLRELRRLYPAARITLVCNAEIAALAETCPYIDEHVAFTLRPRPLPLDQVGAWRDARRFARRLGGRGFDLAIMPRWDIDAECAQAIAYYLGIPLRVGFGPQVSPLKAIKNFGFDRLLTHAVPAGDDCHETALSLDVLRALGGEPESDRLEAWPSREDRAAAAAIITAAFPGIDDASPLVSLALGASLDRKRWPVERYAAVAQDLIDQHNARILVLGSGVDQSAARAVVARCHRGGRVVDLAGQLSVNETLAVMERSALFIGNDSGPAHMAAAMGIPVIMISSQPSGGHRVLGHPPERYFPWGVRHRIIRPAQPRPPCTDRCWTNRAHCVLAVAVEEVVAAARSELSG